jgi:hypothetical protein
MPIASLHRYGIALAAVLGCTPPGEQSPAPEPRERHAPAIIVDRERDLFPDPHDRTRVRMEAVGNVLQRHAAAHGRLPETLSEFLPPRGTTAIDFWHDGWETEFRYTRPAEDRWELTAAGPDRRFGTPDDVVVEGRFAPPVGNQRGPGE